MLYDDQIQRSLRVYLGLQLTEGKEPAWGVDEGSVSGGLGGGKEGIGDGRRKQLRRGKLIIFKSVACVRYEEEVLV